MTAECMCPLVSLSQYFVCLFVCFMAVYVQRAHVFVCICVFTLVYLVVLGRLMLICAFLCGHAPAMCPMHVLELGCVSGPEYFST